MKYKATIDDCDLANILVALRQAQNQGWDNEFYAYHFAEEREMDANEIDDLCERLNTESRPLGWNGMLLRVRRLF